MEEHGGRILERRNREYLSWIRVAEEALKEGDYGVAAHYFRRVANYFWLIRDKGEFEAFARRACECHLRAAEGMWNRGDHLRASSFYGMAAGGFREIGDKTKAESCDQRVSECYETIVREGFSSFLGGVKDLRRMGDHFEAEGKQERAAKCYREAAERAIKEGKLAVAAGLYRDAGECHRLLNDPEGAAKAYEKAADSYFKGERYFEAAWHYNLAGFLLISMRRFNEAQKLAGSAEIACLEGRVTVLLNHLTRVCEGLSKGNTLEAQEEWGKIRRKFKVEYATLVDNCFKALQEAHT